MTARRKHPAKWHYQIDLLEAHECRTLLEAAPATSWRSCRTRVFVVLWWRAGLRYTSSVHVRPCDLRLDQNHLHAVARGPCDCRSCQDGFPWAKGGHGYSPGLCDLAVEEIRRFLPLRARMLGGEYPERPLVCTRAGAVVGLGQAWRMLRRLSKRAGLAQRRVHPHGLRHALAYQLFCEGWPVADIATQLGHRSILTTEIYLHRLYAAHRVHQLMRDRGRQPDSRAQACERLAEVEGLIRNDYERATNPEKLLRRVIAAATGRKLIE